MTRNDHKDQGIKPEITLETAKTKQPKPRKPRTKSKKGKKESAPTEKKEELIAEAQDEPKVESKVSTLLCRSSFS